jgi:hypothetical protein
MVWSETAFRLHKNGLALGQVSSLINPFVLCVGAGYPIVQPSVTVLLVLVAWITISTVGWMSLAHFTY